MITSLSTLLIASLTLCQAHQQLVWPYALRSKYNPSTPPNLIDYNMKAPLTSTDFPCKGYQADTPIVDTTTYAAGKVYNMTLEGTATHGGGSCQISLSYDSGKTFKVIKSIIGGCTLQHTYFFTIPAYAPAGHALFAWSWSNYMGNREFYMNCAAVQVTSSTTSPTQFNTLPNIWVANLASINKCNTNAPNGAMNVVYPEPGPDVEYGTGMSSASPLTRGDCEVPLQARAPADPSFAFDPVSSTVASTPSSTQPVFVFDPVSSSKLSTAVSSTPSFTTTLTSTYTTTSTTFSTSTSIFFSVSFPPSTTSSISTISPLQASSSTPSRITSSSPTAITSRASNGSTSLLSISVTTTTITLDCPSTVVVTLPPTSFVATYTVSSTASACTGTAAICPCANAFACMNIGDCTWECLPVSTPTGPSFQTSVVPATTSPTSRPAVTSTPAVVTSTAQPTPSPAPSGQPGYVNPASLSSYLPCAPGTFICTDPSTWYTCLTGADGLTSYQYPRQVAAGMQCEPDLTASAGFVQGNTPPGYYRDDQYIAARPYGSCPTDGAFQCTNGGQGFQVCDHGGWVDMGAVAAGTRCVNGQIVAA